MARFKNKTVGFDQHDRHRYTRTGTFFFVGEWPLSCMKLLQFVAVLKRLRDVGHLDRDVV